MSIHVYSFVENVNKSLKRFIGTNVFQHTLFAQGILYYLYTFILCWYTTSDDCVSDSSSNILGMTVTGSTILTSCDLVIMDDNEWSVSDSGSCGMNNSE